MPEFYMIFPKKTFLPIVFFFFFWGGGHERHELLLPVSYAYEGVYTVYFKCIFYKDFKF